MIAINDDNNKINVKSYILDPLTVIIKLAILNNKPIGTKLLIQNNVIYFQEPGPFQSLSRMFYKTNKTDLQYLFNPLHVACMHFLSKTFSNKTERIKKLFICAQNGLKKLIETYKSCTIITLTLNYYYALLTNHIQEVYNENMFIKDSFTCYYTQPICDSLNKQWTDVKIKVILDLITFLMGNDDAANNVKSLETIISGIDDNTKTIISEIF
jgi:hypothetical protein